MLLEAKERLENKLVETLAIQPDQSAYQLREIVSNSSRNYSIQAVYKELRKLQRNGVVAKNGETYFLRLPWMLNLLSFAEKAAKINRQKHQIILPKKNERLIWHFNDLLKMNDFWSHLLLILIKQSKNKVLLGWNPHPWFHLVQTEQEQQYIKSLKLLKSKLYLIIGDNSYLDRLAEKFLKKEAVKYSFHKNKIGFKRTEYVNCIDNFVLTVKMDTKTTNMIENIYTSIKKPEDVDISAILKIFHQSTRASIWLENKTKKADSVRAKFRKFFWL